MKIRFSQTICAVVLIAAASGVHAQTSPYAGEQQRSIKALSERDVSELQSGHGMGLAKSAELNGYPGPSHVLELAAPLELTAQQQAATRALLASHKAAAREMGVRLIEAERALDDAFATQRVDPQSLADLTLAIGQQQAQLRAEHLRTHLTETALLTPEQVARYSQLRGYGGAAPQPPADDHSDGHAAGHVHGEAGAIGAPGDKAKVTRSVKVDMTDTMRFNPADISAKQGETIRFVVIVNVSSAAGQTSAQPTPASAAQANTEVDMTDGEVRKIDKENGRITLKHGEIKNLEMPGMTMVFQVKDPAMLDTVKQGDKVKFKAEKANGALVVTQIQAAK